MKMETQQQFSVTLTGKNFADVIKNAQTLVNTYGSVGSTNEVKSTIIKTAPAKKVVAPVEDEDDFSLDAAADEDDDFTTEVTTPAKKATKAPKLTDSDVNNACKAYAKVHGKPATLAILKKKFKVQSILELKADQYGAAIEALEV